jgi:hypothetical protein
MLSPLYEYTYSTGRLVHPWVFWYDSSTHAISISDVDYSSNSNGNGNGNNSNNFNSTYKMKGIIELDIMLLFNNSWYSDRSIGRSIDIDIDSNNINNNDNIDNNNNSNSNNNNNNTNSSLNLFIYYPYLCNEINDLSIYAYPFRSIYLSIYLSVYASNIYLSI